MHDPILIKMYTHLEMKVKKTKYVIFQNWGSLAPFNFYRSILKSLLVIRLWWKLMYNIINTIYNYKDKYKWNFWKFGPTYSALNLLTFWMIRFCQITSCLCHYKTKVNIIFIFSGGWSPMTSLTSIVKIKENLSFMIWFWWKLIRNNFTHQTNFVASDGGGRCIADGKKKLKSIYHRTNQRMAWRLRSDVFKYYLWIELR